MKKQELKSRKKVHAHKRWKKRHKTLQQKETAIVKYKPEVIAIKEMRKRVKERIRA